MRYDNNLLSGIESDLGLNSHFVKGQDIPVRNCWHFFTDGNKVESVFYDEPDFIRGMNRIYSVLRDYDVTILAFCLMDTHVHFILHGEFDVCYKFMKEYLRRTSMDVSSRHSYHNIFGNSPLSHQIIDDDAYLKTSICYTIKNPPEGGLHYNAYDYPWSSGALYFRKKGLWTSPAWLENLNAGVPAPTMSIRQKRIVLGSRKTTDYLFIFPNGLIPPSEYVSYRLVEQLFRTERSYLFFMGKTKSRDVESRGGAISHLSMPIQEMRQHKNELCLELFGTVYSRNLEMGQRIRLAKALRARYNSSLKQIARLCGLVYDEVKDMIK